MSEEDRLDMVTLSDEEGNELLFSVAQYFYYNGQEYVHLHLREDQSPDQAEGQGDYVMLVETSQDEEGEDIEDFVPIEPALMESLLQALQARHRPMDPDQE